MSVRHTVIPTLHSHAELVALPFASERALELGITELALNLTSTTGDFWRATEAQLIGESPAISLDELGAMRDSVWFDGAGSTGSTAVPLADLLRRVAHQHLAIRGAVAHPKDSEAEAHSGSDALRRARTLWRWLSFALPPDLLLAASGKPYPAGSIEAVSSTLGAELEQQGFSETHVHRGAAMSFDVLWAAALQGIASSALREDGLGSAGAALGEGKELAPWMIRAVIARYLLGGFLSVRGSRARGLEHWLQDMRLEISEFRGRITVTTVLDQALEDLCVGRLTLSPDGPTFASLQGLYADITGVRRVSLAHLRGTEEEGPSARETLQDVFQLDPLHRYVGTDERWPSPEVWFIASGLQYQEDKRKTGRADELFERLFWQVVRVRCLLYRHVVQRPMTPGLQWFVRVYDRIKPLRRSLASAPASVSVAAALSVCGEGRGLRALELRTAPNGSVQENLNEILRLRHVLVPSAPRPSSDPSREGRDVRRPVSLGYILHFIRNRGDLTKGKQPAHWAGCVGDPSYNPRYPKKGNPTGYRFAQYYLERRREALVLARTLTAFPVSLEFLRGVDLCTDEVGIPTWVLAPLIRYVCDASKAAALALQHHDGSAPSAFRRAVHAGEDFVHLMSGMRRLHQSIVYLKLEDGDRIGHGLSLGLDPEQWAKGAGRIAMTREDRLFDLVWAWSWMTRAKIPATSAASLEREIRQLAETIFDGASDRKLRLEPSDIARLVDDLHTEERLSDVGFPSRHRRGGGQDDEDPRRVLLHRYLTDDGVYRRGMGTVWVSPEKEYELLADLQKAMQRDVAERDITVEVNPTSNLLIGHVPDLRNHPLWRLAPGPHKRKDSAAPLSICVGSDDPITFATTLRQEYQLLYDALVEDGASSVQAHEWVDQVRQVGLHRSVTVPRSDRELTEPIRVHDDLTLPP